MGIFARLIFGRSKFDKLQTSINALALQVDGLTQRIKNFERKFDMSQEKFDAQVEELMSINREIRDAVAQESSELSALSQVFKEEIADLKAKLEECKNAPVDTSRLDAAIAELKERAATISTIVTPPVQQEPPQPIDEPSAETPSEEVPAEAPTDENPQ